MPEHLYVHKSHMIQSMISVWSHADILCCLITSIQLLIPPTGCKVACHSSIPELKYPAPNVIECAGLVTGFLTGEVRAKALESGLFVSLWRSILSVGFFFPDGLPFFLRGLWRLWLRKLLFCLFDSVPVLLYLFTKVSLPVPCQCPLQGGWHLIAFDPPIRSPGSHGDMVTYGYMTIKSTPAHADRYR